MVILAGKPSMVFASTLILSRYRMLFIKHTHKGVGMTPALTLGFISLLGLLLGYILWRKDKLITTVANTETIYDISWKKRWSLLASWASAALAIWAVIACITFMIDMVQNNHMKEAQQANIGPTNETHFFRIVVGDETVGNYENSTLANLALALKPLVAIDSTTDSTPDNINNFEVNSDKYDGVSSYFTFCAFQEKQDQTCDDHGHLSGQMQRSLTDIIVDPHSKLLQLPGPIAFHRFNGPLLRERLFLFVWLDWLWCLLWPGLVGWTDKPQNKKVYLDLLEPHDEKIFALLFNPYLLFGWLLLRLKQHFFNTERGQQLRRIQRDKLLEKAQFADELKQVYKLRDKLQQLSSSEEVRAAKEFVEASIKTLQEVPKQIKKDEDRIRAMNIAKEARSLLLPAEAVFDAHKELMAEYHEGQLAEDMRALEPPKKS